MLILMTPIHTDIRPVLKDGATKVNGDRTYPCVEVDEKDYIASGHVQSITNRLLLFVDAKTNEEVVCHGYKSKLYRLVGDIDDIRMSLRTPEVKLHDGGVFLKYRRFTPKIRAIHRSFWWIYDLPAGVFNRDTLLTTTAMFDSRRRGFVYDNEVFKTYPELEGQKYGLVITADGKVHHIDSDGESLNITAKVWVKHPSSDMVLTTGIRSMNYVKKCLADITDDLPTVAKTRLRSNWIDSRYFTYMVLSEYDRMVILDEINPVRKYIRGKKDAFYYDIYSINRLGDFCVTELDALAIAKLQGIIDDNPAIYFTVGECEMIYRDAEPTVIYFRRKGNEVLKSVKIFELACVVIPEPVVKYVEVESPLSVDVIQLANSFRPDPPTTETMRMCIDLCRKLNWIEHDPENLTLAATLEGDFEIIKTKGGLCIQFPDPNWERYDWVDVTGYFNKTMFDRLKNNMMFSSITSTYYRKNDRLYYTNSVLVNRSPEFEYYPT